MKSRRRIIVAVLILLGLPAALAATLAVTYFVSSRSNGFFVSSGEQREYLLHVPKSYDRTRPTPLVISLHGAALYGAAQKEISQWNRVADAEGFIVVYPSGVKGRGLRVWRMGSEMGGTKDVEFIAKLIDTLSAHYNIDPARIYANGLSNGGGMSFALSCTMSDRIAAVGTVGAAQLLPFEWCPNPKPVPLINFHGTADPAAAYKGGWSWMVLRRFPDVQRWTASWARRNRCAPTPVDSAVAADVTRRTWVNCADDAAVVLYTIVGGGHTWPGGGPVPEWSMGRTSRSIDASSLMWLFFREHPLRGAQSGLSVGAAKRR
jgi:polyhydroxybutyrate depolymerase